MKNKKKLLVLSVFVVLAIIFSVVYVVAVGNHYTLHTKTFLGTEQLPRLEIKLSDDSVVRMADARMENEELVVVFEALNPGKTTVNISFEPEDGFAPLHERAFGISICCLCRFVCSFCRTVYDAVDVQRLSEEGRFFLSDGCLRRYRNI